MVVKNDIFCDLRKGKDSVVSAYKGNELVYSSYIPGMYRAISGVESTGAGLVIENFSMYSVDFKVKSKVHYKKYGGGTLFGGYVQDTVDTWRFFVAGGRWYYDNMGRISGGSINTTKIYNLEIGNYYVKDLDANSNILSSTAKQSYTTATKFNIFSANDYGIIYELSMWHGDDIVAEFIPCVVRSSGVVGLYDRLSRTFYSPSSGTWYEV